MGHLGGLVGGVLAGWVFRDRAETAGTGTRILGQRGGDGLGDTAVLGTGGYQAGGEGGGRRSAKGGSVPGSPRSDLLKELDDLGL